MRNCKLFLLLLLFLFVFTACQSAEQPTPIPETPESIVEEPEPVPEEPAPIVEEPEPILLPDPAAIEAKTQQASICPCLAMEHAQWNLARHGFPDYTGEPLNSVLAAFSAHVTENWDSLAQTYGDLLNGTLWIIDHDENGYYLQIIRFAESAEQLLMLQWDGAEITVFEETRPMEEYEYAVCEKYNAPGQSEQAVDWCEALKYQETIPAFFYRISTVGTGQFARTSFYPTAENSDTIYVTMDNRFPYSFGAEYLPLLPTKPLPVTPISPVVEKLLQADVSSLRTLMNDGQLNEVLLQEDLFRHTSAPDTTGNWDAPGLASPQVELLMSLRSQILVFLEELELDPELKALYLSMDHWAIESTGGFTVYVISGYTQNTRRISITVTPISADSADWVTPSRKRIQKLADEGSGSDLIPEEIRNAFVSYVLREYHYCFEQYDDAFAVKWVWSMPESDVYSLRIEKYHENSTEETPETWALLKWESGNIIVEDISYK